jgi:hypothetical protein
MSAFGTAVLACVVVGHPPPAVAQVGQQRAQEYFKEADAAAYKSHVELCRNCVRCPRNSPTNTDVYGFTSRRMQWREVVESTAQRGVSVSLGERRPNCFPSVLLQPLFVNLCRDIKGPLVAEAYIAALAIEHGCELVTTDDDFARFPGRRWRHPLAGSR